MSTLLLTPPSATTSAAAAAAPDAPRRIRTRARELGLHPVVKRCKISGVKPGTETDDEESETAEETAARIKAKADAKALLAKKTEERLSQFSGILSVFFGQWFHEMEFSKEVCFLIAEYARVVRPRFSPEIHGITCTRLDWGALYGGYLISSIGLDVGNTSARVSCGSLPARVEDVDIIPLPSSSCFVNNSMDAQFGDLPERWTLRLVLNHQTNVPRLMGFNIGSFFLRVTDNVDCSIWSDGSGLCTIGIGKCPVSVVDLQFIRLDRDEFHDSPFTPYKISITVTEGAFYRTETCDVFGNISDRDKLQIWGLFFTGTMQLIDDTGSSWC
jgi:hypothetical protein